MLSSSLDNISGKNKILSLLQQEGRVAICYVYIYSIQEGMHILCATLDSVPRQPMLSRQDVENVRLSEKAFGRSNI